jgi:hypothetical protein
MIVELLRNDRVYSHFDRREKSLFMILTQKRFLSRNSAEYLLNDSRAPSK